MLTIRDGVVTDMLGLCALRDTPSRHEAKVEQAAYGTARFLVAVSEGDVVAFSTLVLRNPTVGPPKSYLPKLSDCFVAPRHRALGIGRALVCARERIAQAGGHDRLYVSVDPVENRWWFDFFRRRGYQPLQFEPYRKREPRHTADGKPEEVLAWRQDLVLDFCEMGPA